MWGREFGHGSEEWAGARGPNGTPSRLGLHRSLCAGVHEHQRAVPAALACHASVEDQLTRRDQGGTEQPCACRWGWRLCLNDCQSILRQDERPHIISPWHAATLDGDRPGGRFGRNPGYRFGTEHPGRSARMVLGSALLQRTPGRSSGGATRPGSACSTRPAACPWLP